MKNVFTFAALAIAMSSSAMGADAPQPFVTGLKNPESVCYGFNGLLYVTEIGEFGKDGDGQVSVIRNNKAEPFTTGLNDPKGMVFHNNALYLTDLQQVIRIDASGKASVFAAPADFPTAPLFLNDIAVEPRTGTLLVTDSGDRQGGKGAVYQIDIRTKQIKSAVNTETLPELNMPNGVVFDGETHFRFVDMRTGVLYSVNTHNQAVTKIEEGFEGADGLVWDMFGRFFVTTWTTGKVHGIPRPGEKPVVVAEGLESAADGCLASDGKHIIVPDMKAGALVSVSTTIPGWEVDESPVPVGFEVAFPNLKWTGWDSGEESGRITPLRPILLTHANDGTNRVFVPTQHGVIHVFENDDNVKETKVFLDISDKVRYRDRANEEGFLGLAFHPNYKENGEFFVFYTDVEAEMTNVVSRFRVKKDDPNSADPASEEQLIRFDRPFWNHDGGTVVFGPDGYLYITHGDGGSGGDPYRNGQNLKTYLGKVLRIDVDRKEDGKNYAIPADNPFVNNPEAAPEIWAYGLRNIWRMAFDRETGKLWAGEVGQNLFEEINIITAGGNYGWNLRESFHPFGPEGVDVREDLIEPLWEYHHDLGKSITGGLVYRGSKIPELQGTYLYADYVSMLFWALRYDEEQGRVVANHPINNPNLIVLSFGEDQHGEVYVLSASSTGEGIHRLIPNKKQATEK